MTDVVVYVRCRDDGDEKAGAGLDDVSTSQPGEDNPVVNRGMASGKKKSKAKKAFNDM